MGTKKIKTYKNKTRKNKKPSKNPIKILKNLINPKNTKKVPKDEIIKELPTILFYPKINECIVSNYISFETEFGKNLTKSSSKHYEDDLIKLLKKAYSPSSVNINDDFYGYINYHWLQDTNTKSEKYEKHEKYFSQIDNFRIIQNKVYKELVYIVEDYIKNNDSKQSKCISTIYNSFKKNSIKKNIDILFKNYDSYWDNDDLIGYLSLINRNEIVNWGCPIHWKVEPDLKNSKVYQNYISVPKLSLYNYELYFILDTDSKETVKYKNLVKKKYFEYLTKLFKVCVGENNDYDPQDVFDVENEILNAFSSTDIKNDSPDFYNVVTKKDSIEKYGFDWENFSKQLGFEKTPNTFICSSLNYLNSIMKLVKEKWKTKPWKCYLKYIIFRQFIRFDPETRHIHYDFFENFLKGQQEMVPEDIYRIIPLSYTFNTFLVTEYDKINNNPQNIDFVQRFGEDLLTVFKRIITNENTWFSPSTKKKALLKLSKIKILVGRPQVLRYDPLFDYDPDNLYFNLRKLSLWKSAKYVKLVGKPLIDIPLFDWQEFKMTGQQSYIVNAFYIPNTNSIFIPLSYLQTPFIDLGQRGIEYNLASLGYTLTHEMCHSLDELGSKYDENGNMNDWWTTNDKQIYTKLKDDIIAQYTTFALRDGIKFDASIGIGEDIADIAGLWVCQEYLRDYQINKEYISPIIRLSYETFFIYFALLQKQFIYKKAVVSQLTSNPHPMNKYRTNIPLTRLNLFRNLYNIKKGDGMWWGNSCSIIEDFCLKGTYKKIKSTI